MKRSQMVERIYDLLNCDGVLEHSMPKLEPVSLTEEHVRWISEQIVQEFEQGGMLPPMSDETMSSNPFNVTDSILESVAHDFKWDSEE